MQVFLENVPHMETQRPDDFLEELVESVGLLAAWLGFLSDFPGSLLDEARVKIKVHNIRTIMLLDVISVPDRAAFTE